MEAARPPVEVRVVSRRRRASEERLATRLATSPNDLVVVRLATWPSVSQYRAGKGWSPGLGLGWGLGREREVAGRGHQVAHRHRPCAGARKFFGS